MKREIRNTINYILDQTLNLEDDVYITFIFTDDPRATQFNNIAETFVIYKQTRKGKAVLIPENKRKPISKKDLLSFFNEYITDDSFSTMLSVEEENGDNIFFYNIDTDEFYED